MKPIVISLVTYNRLGFTQKTMASLSIAVHDIPYNMYVVDNGSTDGTQLWLMGQRDIPLRYETICYPDNKGTATAVNVAWGHRAEGQHCLKLDNDFVVQDKNWLWRALAILAARPDIGTVAVKWDGNPENPEHTNVIYKSKLSTAGQETVEECLYPISPAMLVRGEVVDKIGGLIQPMLYGYDDLLYLHRVQKAGYKTVFMLNSHASHLDGEYGGATAVSDYGKFKNEQAHRSADIFSRMVSAYDSGELPLRVPLDADLNALRKEFYARSQ